MKVVFLIGSNDVGGAEFVSYHHVLMAFRNGYDVTVVSGSTGKFYDKMVLEGVNIFVVGMRPDISAIEPYIVGCDMVFNCNFFAVMDITVMLRKKYGFWYSYILHSDIEWVCTQVEKYNNEIDIFYAIHQKIVDVIVSRGKVAEEKFVVINNCVDVDGIKNAAWSRAIVRAKLGYKSNDFVIGMVTRVAQDKNIYSALEILRLLPAGINFKLLIIGGAADNSGSRDYSHWLKEIIRKDKGLNRRVHITGNLTSERVYSFVKAIDLGLNCSPNEGLPIALLEMMAAGIACVMPGIGDIPSVLTGRGVVVQVKQRLSDVDIWADKYNCYTKQEIGLFTSEIVKLRRNEVLRLEYGKLAAEYIENTRSIKFQEKQFLNFLELANGRDIKKITTTENFDEQNMSYSGNYLPRVSVLMPTRDANLEWISEAIGSIVNQDYQGEIEFVIVNHDSRMGFTKAIKELIEQLEIGIEEPEKKFMFKYSEVIEAASLAQVLDKGLFESTGEIIVRMDHDDIAESNLISSTVGYLIRNKNIDIVGVQIKFFGDKDTTTKHPRIVSKQVAYNMKSPVYWFLNHPGATMRRKALIEVGGYGDTAQGFAEDYRLWCKFLKSGRVIINLPEVLVHYRCYTKYDRVKPAGYMEFLNKEKAALKG